MSTDSVNIKIRMSDSSEYTSDTAVVPSEYTENFLKAVEPFEHFTDLDYLTLEINERERVFNPNHILWLEIIVAKNTRQEPTMTVEELQAAKIYAS